MQIGLGTRVSLVAFAALASCASPQQRCVNEVGRDLRTVNDLIVETQDNLRRGFRYEIEPAPSSVGIGFCTGSYNVRFCSSNFNSVRRRAVAIDPAEEQAKLNALIEQRQTLQLRSQNAAAFCQGTA